MDGGERSGGLWRLVVAAGWLAAAAGAIGCGSGSSSGSGSAIAGGHRDDKEGSGGTTGGNPGSGGASGGNPGSGGAPTAAGCAPLPSAPGVWAEISPAPGVTGFRASDAFPVGTDDFFFTGAVVDSNGIPSSTHVLRWSHGCWTDELTYAPPPALSNFRPSVHGTGPADVWAVAGELIFHRDAQGWSPFANDGWRAQLRQPLPFNNPLDLVRVRAAGVNDVWVAATAHMLRWNGSAWTVYNLDTAEYPNQSASIGYNYYDFWFDGPNDVWIGATADQIGNTMDGGLAFHFNGTNFAPFPVNPGSAVYSVWRGGASLWLASLHLSFANGVTMTVPLQRLEGSTSEGVQVQGIGPNDSSPFFTTLWGRGANDLWASGDNVGHFDGQQWTLVTDAPPATRSGPLDSVVTGDAGSVWLTAPGPRFFRRVTAP